MVPGVDPGRLPAGNLPAAVQRRNLGEVAEQASQHALGLGIHERNREHPLACGPQDPVLRDVDGELVVLDLQGKRESVVAVQLLALAESAAQHLGTLLDEDVPGEQALVGRLFGLPPQRLGNGRNKVRGLGHRYRLRPPCGPVQGIQPQPANLIPQPLCPTRYGSKRHDVESARQPQVRNAFNSPFWPFVLTTTSVGQEGIDFHWWCHAVVHWNLPANPVDFEQREGRVNRFGGHAVRRNIAARHRVSVMTSQEADPWKAAYDAARDQSAHLGEFAPYWIYPGSFRVERQLINYPLSRDIAKVAALKDDLALYRLAFGQPRQEDLLDFLKRIGIDGAGTAGIDLRPDAVRPPNSVETDPVQPEGSQY